MARLRIRKAFVLTCSAGSAAGGLFGCANAAPVEISGNPPEQQLTATTAASSTSTSSASSVSSASSGPLVSATAAEPARGEDVARNPVAQGGAVRLSSNGSCFVYKPFGPLKPGEQRPPGTEPPHATVTCPKGFADDPAYKDCIDGVVLAKADGSGCLCAVGGNPPPVPRPVVCPK